MEVTVRGHAAVSPEKAWETIVAVERYPGVVGSYVSVEPITSDTRRVGTRWRQTRTVFGRRHAQVLEITEWDPPRAMTTTAVESGAIYTTRHRLDGGQDGTSIEVRFGVRSSNALATLFQRLLGARMLKSTESAMQRDLADLIVAMEAAATSGG